MIICGGIWKGIQPFFIKGSAHTMNECDINTIRIGCEIYSIEYWLENYKTIGWESGYSKAQIKEYGRYLKLYKKLRG